MIFGQEGHAKVAECSLRLEGALNSALSALGVNAKKFLIRLGRSVSAVALDRRMPSVGVFFGFAPSPALSTNDASMLTTLISDGFPVIPVLEDLRDFAKNVPDHIAQLNGVALADCGAELERLAACVLEGFGLLRERRRLFISYRRIETSGVAAQLYEALDAAGFDVFLDTHGVLRPGEPFQEILWHRLADTDVALILDSPGFLASRWTEEELARANTSNIQLLQVLWPGQVDGATGAFSSFHPLEGRDFLSPEKLGPVARLTDAAVHEIVDSVERLRARAIGARHSFLVREFSQEARRAGLQVRTTLDYSMVLDGHRGRSLLVLPAVGVPDAARYEALARLFEREVKNGRSLGTPPILLYDQTGIRTKWLRHLEWLNSNVSTVRSVSLAEAKNWLDSLVSKRET